MYTTESISWELVLNPELARKLAAIESVLKSNDNSIAIIYGRSDVVRESFDGIDALYIHSPISFVARKSTEGIIVESI